MLRFRAPFALEQVGTNISLSLLHRGENVSRCVMLGTLIGKDQFIFDQISFTRHIRTYAATHASLAQINRECGRDGEYYERQSAAACM